MFDQCTHLVESGQSDELEVWLGNAVQQAEELAAYWTEIGGDESLRRAGVLGADLELTNLIDDWMGADIVSGRAKELSAGSVPVSKAHVHETGGDESLRRAGELGEDKRHSQRAGEPGDVMRSESGKPQVGGTKRSRPASISSDDEMFHSGQKHVRLRKAQKTLGANFVRSRRWVKDRVSRGGPFLSRHLRRLVPRLPVCG